MKSSRVLGESPGRLGMMLFSELQFLKVALYSVASNGVHGRSDASLLNTEFALINFDEVMTSTHHIIIIIQLGSYFHLSHCRTMLSTNLHNTFILMVP